MHRTNSSSNTSIYLDQELKGMNGMLYEVKSKIADYLKGIKCRIKATENTLKELEDNQRNCSESVRQRAIERDQEVTDTLFQSLDTLMYAMDEYANESARIRGDVEKKLANAQDTMMKVLCRFETDLQNKYLKFMQSVANEIHIIRVVLERDRGKVSPNFRHEKPAKDKSSRRRIGSEVKGKADGSKLKGQLTVPKMFRYSKKSSDCISGRNFGNRTEKELAAGDIFVPGVPSIHELRQFVASNVESKLNSLKIPTGSSRITDSEYRLKIRQLRKDFEKVRSNLPSLPLVHQRLEEELDEEVSSCKKVPVQNGKMTFLPSLRNNVFVRKVHRPSVKRNMSLKFDKTPEGNRENMYSFQVDFEKQGTPELECQSSKRQIPSVPRNELNTHTILTRHSELFDGSFSQRNLQNATKIRSREIAAEELVVERGCGNGRTYFDHNDLTKTNSILSFYKSDAEHRANLSKTEEIEITNSQLVPALEHARSIALNSKKTVEYKGKSSESFKGTDPQSNEIDKADIFSIHESDGSMEDFVNELLTSTSPITTNLAPVSETRTKEKLNDSQISELHVRSKAFNHSSQELFQRASEGSKLSVSKIRSSFTAKSERAEIVSDMSDIRSPDNKDDTPAELKNSWDSESFSS